MENLENKTPEEIENLRIETIKELDKVDENLNKIILEDIEVNQKIAELKLQHERNRTAIVQGRHLKQALNRKIEILKSAYWRARN